MEETGDNSDDDDDDDLLPMFAMTASRRASTADAAAELGFQPDEVPESQDHASRAHTGLHSNHLAADAAAADDVIDLTTESQVSLDVDVGQVAHAREPAAPRPAQEDSQADMFDETDDGDDALFANMDMPSESGGGGKGTVPPRLQLEAQLDTIGKRRADLRAKLAVADREFADKKAELARHYGAKHGGEAGPAQVAHHMGGNSGGGYNAAARGPAYDANHHPVTMIDEDDYDDGLADSEFPEEFVNESSFAAKTVSIGGGNELSFHSGGGGGGGGGARATSDRAIPWGQESSPPDAQGGWASGMTTQTDTRNPVANSSAASRSRPSGGNLSTLTSPAGKAADHSKYSGQSFPHSREVKQAFQRVFGLRNFRMHQEEVSAPRTRPGAGTI